MKLRNFFYLLLALPLFFAGCTEPGTDEPVKKEATLTLVSDQTMNYGHNGGNGVITFKLENAPEDAQVSASCEADWVTNLKVGTNVTFKVAANEGEARETKVVVSYLTQSFEVTVTQSKFLVEVESACFEGGFVGYTEKNTVNYTIYLSDFGFNSYGQPVAGGSYYVLDIYCAEEPQRNEEGYILLPAGTYEYDTEGTKNAFTVNALASAFIKINDEGTDYAANIPFENATLVLTAEGVTLNAIVNSDEHIVTYGAAPTLFVGKPIAAAEHTFECLDGEYYATDYSATYNYCLYISNIGLQDGYAVAGGIYYMVDLYGLEPVIDEEGYLTVPAGTYTFDPNDGCAEWSVGNQYSGYFAINAEGTAYDGQATYDDVTVVVGEDSIVIECVIQGKNHKVTYNGVPKFFVGIPLEDTTFQANVIQGVYYANQYTDAYNYFVYLSDLGFDEEGNTVANATYYAMDLYGVEPAIDAEGNLTIPAGTYTFDYYDSAAEWTMGNYYSSFVKVNADYTGFDYYLAFDDGVVVVTENGIEALFEIDGSFHTVTYTGAPTFNIGATRAAKPEKSRLTL